MLRRPEEEAVTCGVAVILRMVIDVGGLLLGSIINSGSKVDTSYMTFSFMCDVSEVETGICINV